MLPRLSANHEMCRPPTYLKYQCKPAASALESLPRIVMFSGDVEFRSSKRPFVPTVGASSSSMNGDNFGARRSRRARIGPVVFVLAFVFELLFHPSSPHVYHSAFSFPLCFSFFMFLIFTGNGTSFHGFVEVLQYVVFWLATLNTKLFLKLYDFFAWRVLSDYSPVFT